MGRKKLIALVTVQVLVLAVLLGAGIFLIRENSDSPEEEILLQDTTPLFTEATEPETLPPTEPPTEAPTEAPTEPTEPPTEPGPESFVLSFVGDCTFGCNAKNVNATTAFPKTVGDDYAYPMENVVTYFQNDDYTFANLEGVLGDEGKARNKKYVFRGSGEYTKILTENSIEAVTIANNHAKDYGSEGYDETKRLLGEAGVTYVGDMGSTVITTESGLTIGLYAVDMSSSVPEATEITADIQDLQAEGVELIVCAFHWGYENTFQQNEDQIALGRAAIDAGADIVWGSHPHVLQPIEEYNGGIIYYSLGNFSFGGNSKPKDFDTAIVQQEVIRELNGSVHLGELTIIPCSISSIAGLNNYQPTPYEEGSKTYDRVLRKLDGSYNGKNLPIG